VSGNVKQPDAAKDVFVFPMSFSQQRLWFLDQLEPGSPVYNTPFTLRLTGPLNLAALEQSLSEIVRRHEVLRANFRLVQAQPSQLIQPARRLSIPVVDLTALARDEQEEKARKLAQEESQRPFNLSRDNLVRASVLRMAAQDHILLLGTHHIVFDAWSRGILLHELAALYEAYCTGKPSPLPDLPVQYTDFAVWQREFLSGATQEKQLAYWRDRLGNAPANLELPTDRPRPPVQTFRGNSQPLTLPKDLADRLKSLSWEQGTTLFMTLLAAFQALLSRYSGQEDIVVGTPIANRNRAELEGLIGFFANTLALRADVSGNPTFRELLARVKEGALGAYAHQDVPFEKLVEELKPERSLSHNPLFQVLFALRNVPSQAPQLPGLQVKALRAENKTTRFELALILSETQDGLTGRLEYNTDLFDGTTIERMAGHLRQLLEGVVANPDQRVCDLPLLTEAERYQVLVEWNRTRVDYPCDRSLHQFIEEQVERTPDAPALVYESQQLTYRELNARANQLAHHLRKLGVGPDVLVGICAERSVEMVVGLLGIMKAGGAYVPLDPDYPLDRLAVMMEDARPPVLLTQEHLLRRLPEQRLPVLCLDRDWPIIARESAANPALVTTGKSLAYAIYTSGSTGKPKGVPNVHEGIVNRLLWMQDAYQLAASDRVLQKTPYSFDVSVWEFFWPLMTGACLVVARPGGHKDPAYLVETIAGQKITAMHFVPSMLQIFLQAEGVEHCRSLKKVFCSGEALTVDIQQRFFERLGAELHNLYGPTEAAVDVTYWACRPDVKRNVVPIGRPIANTQIYLLDKSLRPVPIGVAGELHIGGVNLARGYLHRPDLTAEKFIPDPFSREPGARLYKTGDLARFLPDGNIEYLGRMDHQVKLRGFRIELGEIEAVLKTHVTVRDCVVVAREDRPGDKRLVAYLVAAAGQTLTVGDLRSYLKDRLPEYMVPSAFLVLDKMPLSANGKLDRKALPAPDTIGTSSQAYVEPRTPTEEIVAGIWAEILRRKRVGVEDDFFDLGGHSLLATQVIARIRRTFEMDLALRAIFEAPTVAGLARKIEAAQREHHAIQEPPLVATAREGNLPVSFAQQRLWLLDRLEPGSPAYNIPIALRLNGPLQGEALAHSLSEVLRRHEVLRVNFRLHNGEPVQILRPATADPIALVDLSALPDQAREAEAQRLTAEEAHKPFDLQRDPLVRAGLLRLAAEEHIFLLTFHHIVFDGWSSGILLNELTALYEAGVKGQACVLPELPVQYPDFAVWQREYLQGETLEKQLGYWRQQLAGVPAGVELPTDRPRPAVQTFHGANQWMVIAPGVLQGLRDVSRREGATLFMTLLAAFNVLLARYSGQEDLVVGSPIAGRNRAEIEKLIGFFVNTLVLRTDVSGNPTFQELLARTKEVAMGAYAHQEVPFEKLVEELRPDRDMSRNPLFQIMFSLQNTPNESRQLSGLSMRSFKAEGRIAKFDLAAMLLEKADGLKVSFTYNTDLFDDSTITRMLDHFQRLLEAVAVNPAQGIYDLPLLADSERQRVLADFNQTQTDFRRDLTLHHFFEAQAEKTPDAIALVCDRERLRYRELNQRANQLAHYLVQRGVKPEVLVGICAERSLEMLVGILAILKAGGAYVPLDPAYPSERLGYILEDAQAPLLLTQQALLEHLPQHSAEVICLDRDWPVIAQQPAVNPAPQAQAGHLAYVLFTSGSTGRPKGVALEHRSAAIFLQWAQTVFTPEELSGVLFSTSICFDLSVFEMFVPWSVGGQVILAQNALHLPKLPAAQAVTLINTVPSAIAELVRMNAVPDSVRVVNLAGEALPTRLVEQIYQKPTIAKVYNLYGPTEDTTYSTFTLVPRGAEVSIGRPLANTQAYILDQKRRPVPIGVPGELYLAGDGLARGYYGRPDLTAERFVPNPFAAPAGARMYKTGDLARFLPDGNIQYLGRIDNQVKLRGFRIELGEIEAVLLRHPAVQSAVVMAREFGAGDQRLVAYYVAKAGAEVSANDLRAHVKASLPEYMVPSAAVQLEHLPLTPNGKVNRRALPEPAQDAVGSGFVAPSTPMEEALVAIWTTVLRIPAVGVQDNFFDLGGHSLLATQIVSRIEERFNIELPLRSIFERPTISQLSETVEAARKEGGEKRPAMVPVSRAAYKVKRSSL
jgi:amino acid adenylation domain-containing protein